MSVHRIKSTINGVLFERQVEARLTLADFLRHELRLTGTHLGCEHGVCGACTVIVDRKAVRSCLLFAVQIDGKHVSTVEGLGVGEGLSPLQQSFQKHHALQCGFCTPGILNTAHAFLNDNPEPTVDRVREVVSGNICRCTGYIRIVDAIMDAASSYRKIT
jgi:aerobic-type carbon monoxide dehydrogenase small subunit (CoxS/CutS family)